MNDAHISEVVIRRREGLALSWKELWQYRRLFLFLTWRNLILRYKQTFFGIAWAVVRPIIIMITFTIVFRDIANLPSFNIPYPVLVYIAMIPWQFFGNTLTEGTDSLLNESALITKVYFPRLFLPCCPILVSGLDLIIASGLFALMNIFYRLPFSPQIIFLPLFLLLLILFSLGMSFFFSILNVRYRDFRFVVPLLIQVGFFISPIGFSANLLPEKWKFIYSFNPMVGIIESFRWSLLGSKMYPLDVQGLIISVILTLLIFLTGLRFFLKLEPRMIDNM